MIKIRRGLDLPITGTPSTVIEPARPVRKVALVGADYAGLRPTMLVQVGDQVKLGQPLFLDKKTPGVHFTSPGAGTVSAINRGEKRRFLSVVIDLPDKTEGGQESALEFPAFADAELLGLPPEKVRENLLFSGLWTAFRTRPFSKVPQADAKPASIFVTAIDTHPLSADPSIVITRYREDFVRGLQVLSRLSRLFVCTDEKISGDAYGQALENVAFEQFSGPHPAGLPGTHIHFLDPVHAQKSVWHIGYQDVIAVGKLFATGRLWVERVTPLAGPVVKSPRLLLSRLGANLDELTENELEAGENRVISGSVFGGRTAKGATAFLGRYHLQISCLKEGRDREMIHFMRLGTEKHSVTNAYAAAFLKKRLFDFTTTTNGSPRAIVPLGNYEAVMPLDILPTHLLRYLVIGDTEMAQKLGCLELDEEDLALCSYACAGKYEYGPILRDVLTQIEKEG